MFPGAGVEEGETPCDAALRELHEGTGLGGHVERHLGTCRHAARVAHYYLVLVQSGPLRLGGPELELQSVANRHSPTWTLLSELDNENLQPEEIRPLLRSLSPCRPVAPSTIPRRCQRVRSNGKYEAP